MITPILLHLQQSDRMRQARIPGVSMSGVTVVMPPPIGIRAQIPWRLLPATLAGMKILATGATNHAATVIGLLRLTDRQISEFEQALGYISITEQGTKNIIEHDSDLLDLVDGMVRWGAGLARHCPIESASRDLSVLDRLNDDQLEQIMLSAMR